MDSIAELDEPLTVEPLRVGTAGFRRAAIALYAGGFGTFAMLWGVQSLLPALAKSFAVSPAGISLVISLPSFALAATMILAGRLSQRLGRRQVMVGSMAATSVLTLACAFATNLPTLLVLRLLAGIALAGVPSVANVYIAEEVEQSSVNYAIGLSMSGNGLGGMSGRLGTAAVADLIGSRGALIALGLTGCICAVLSWLLLPASRRAPPTDGPQTSFRSDLRLLLADKGFRLLLGVGFLMLGGLMAIFNYAGFRLSAAPFFLSQTEIGALFSVYLAGMAASVYGGTLADRYGRHNVLWIAMLLCVVGDLLTLSDHLSVLLVGVTTLTIGYFAVHTLAVSWAVSRVPAARSTASGLYMLVFYMGGSVFGTAGGLALQAGGWPGVVALVSTLHVIGLLLTLRLRGLPSRA